MTTNDDNYTLQRRGIVLRPDVTLRYESGGVLNPATVTHNGVHYLLYRSVDTIPHNYSRIMIAELRPDGTGMLAHRLGICALEPQEPYELWREGNGGGCEDPRVTPMDDGTYIMAYAAYGDGPGGDATPRIALARSTDLLEWERLGLAQYTPLEIRGAKTTYSIDLQTISNKDAALFPEQIGGRYVLMHRPTLPEAVMHDGGGKPAIWLSYSDDLIHWTDHTKIMESEKPWENMKIGGGTPPIRVPQGWLIVYHGVQGYSDADPDRRYSAGVAILDAADPRRVLYRSPQPVLAPDTDQERVGVVNNVVFPTGVIVDGGRLQVYYGMADEAIGLADMSLPA